LSCWLLDRSKVGNESCLLDDGLLEVRTSRLYTRRLEVMCCLMLSLMTFADHKSVESMHRWMYVTLQLANNLCASVRTCALDRSRLKFMCDAY
jgi:hypothetical protein